MRRSAGIVSLILILCLFLSACGVKMTGGLDIPELPGVPEPSAAAKDDDGPAAMPSSTVQEPQATPVPDAEKESGPSPSPAQEPTPEPADPSDAYRAYLELIRQDRSQIELYNWQKGYYGYGALTDENTARPVVLKDVCGDAIPELIYLKGELYPGQTYAFVASLHVVTWEKGALREVYVSENFDANVAGGVRYLLYTLDNDTSLRAWVSSGDEDWTKAHYAFHANAEGLLVREEVCSYFTGPGPGKDGYQNYIKRYAYGGESVDEEQYDAKLADLESRISEILMYTANLDDSLTEIVNAKDCPAMTVSEAISYLEGLTGQS